MISTLSTANPDFEEALRLMGLLVPFLLDRRSTILHASAGMATTDVYSRFEVVWLMLVSRPKRIIHPVLLFLGKSQFRIARGFIGRRGDTDETSTDRITTVGPLAVKPKWGYCGC